MRANGWDPSPSGDANVERPRSAVPRGVWLLLGVAAALLLTTQLWGLSAFGSLPERVPTHYGPNGAPDAWAQRSPGAVFQGLWVGAGILSAFTVLIVFLDRMPQHYGTTQLTGERYARSTVAVRWFLGAMCLALAATLALATTSAWRGNAGSFPFEVLPVAIVAVVGVPWLIVAMGRDTAASPPGRE